MTTMTISNIERKDIMEIFDYIKESDLSNKGVSKAIENELKEKKMDF